MTKRLPPDEPSDDIATQDEVDAAVDDDSPVELVETGRAAFRGPAGLGFAISVDVRPTQRVFDLLADLIEQAAERPKRRKRKPRKLKP